MREEAVAWMDVNPARAGMIRFDSTTRRCSESKPRASGDDPDDWKQFLDKDG